MHYVYVLRNEHGALYYGMTNDLRRRLQQHNASQSLATRGHQWRLVYYEAYADLRDARNRELRLKNYGQALAQLKRRLQFSLGKS